MHLEATAVWARRFGTGRNATVPCGFGVTITGGSHADVTRYAQGYETFLAERVALRGATRLPYQLPADDRPTVRCGPAAGASRNQRASDVRGLQA